MHISSENHGPQRHTPSELAGVIRRLIDERQPVFNLRTLCQVTGLLPEVAQGCLADLEILGAVKPLKAREAPGVYALVPQRLGMDIFQMGPPYILAPLLTGGRDYYVSHLTAMVLHGMTPWMKPALYIMRPRYTHSRILGGVRVSFVQCKPDHFFGAMPMPLDQSTEITVSDPERTLVDGLRQLKYAAGFANVVSGFLARRDDLDLDKMVHYALRLGFESVNRRLGYLFEVGRVDQPHLLRALHDRIKPLSQYMPLDPTLPRRGLCCQKWRLHVNLSLKAIEQAAQIKHSEHMELFR
jgi:predicted transcriptional regulator of viral defense system